MVDVNADAGFARHGDIAASAGVCAAQSTPLVEYAGRLIGMVSTHFRRPDHPSARDLRVMELYADFAGEAVSAPGHLCPARCRRPGRLGGRLGPA